MKKKQDNILKLFSKKILPKLGRGQVLPVAYDTAWLGRVPAFPDLKKRAFPQALVWLRKNQFAQGGWGSENPANLHGNLLSTLAAILALHEANKKIDKQRIQRAIQFLQKQAWQLNDEADSVGFELLLPALVNECIALKIKLPKRILELKKECEIKSRAKLQFIVAYQQRYGQHKPSSWWFSLEMLGHEKMLNENDFDFDEAMLFPQGSIAASPSATAYFLIALRRRGKNSSRAYRYLKQHQVNGGMPHVAPIDEFELSFSANYLLEAGIGVDTPIMRSLIAAIKQRWQARAGQGFAYSSEFFLDPDDTAVALRVLKLAGEPVSEKSLFPYFNGTCIENFAGESEPSISANIHCLDALQLFNSSKAKAICKKIRLWLKLQLQQKPYLQDKWHCSPFYPTSRAVIALAESDKELAHLLVKWLLQQQRRDGGWGMQQSSVEETAFCALALCHWNTQYKEIDKQVMQQAAQFLKNNAALTTTALWLGKVLYCPYYVVASLQTAARYALEENLNQSHQVLPNESFQLAEFASSYKIPAIQTIAHYLQQWATKIQLYSPEHKIFKSNIVSCAADAYRVKEKRKLKLYAALGLLLLGLDDFMDEAWQQFAKKKINIDAVLKNWLAIWQGKAANIDAEIPRIAALNQGFYQLRKELIAMKVDLSSFIATFALFIKGLLKEYRYRLNKKSLTLKQYLAMRRVVGGMAVANELAWALEKINLKSSLRQRNDFIRLQQVAYDALTIINDLFSYDKEIKTGEFNNYVDFLRKKHRFSSTSALNLIVQDYNAHAANFFHLRTKMLQKISRHDRRAMIAAINVIANQVQAHLNWALMTKRYHSAE